MSADLETRFPNLKNAPIIEAVADFRIEGAPGASLEDLRAFGAGFEDQFLEPTDHKMLLAELKGDEGMKAQGWTANGHVFAAKPGNNLVAQVRLDGFTLGCLPPYKSGESFLEQTRQFWARYVSVAKPVKVTRLGIRTINKIDIPTGVDLQRFVLTGPEIARALPQDMSQFFMQIVLPDISGAVAVIIQTFGESKPGSNTIPLIFDIDATHEVEFAAEDERIWKVFSELRNLKNRIFFNSLTSQALEAYR